MRKQVGLNTQEAACDCGGCFEKARETAVVAPDGTRAVEIPRIELLYIDGCPFYERARQILAEVLAVTDAPGEIQEIKVTSDLRAHQLRFIGSPTIRIDGADVDPVPTGSEQYGLKCRLYIVKGEIRGRPSPEMIWAALKGAGYVA